MQPSSTSPCQPLHIVTVPGVDQSDNSTVRGDIFKVRQLVISGTTGMCVFVIVDPAVSWLSPIGPVLGGGGVCNYLSVDLMSHVTFCIYEAIEETVVLMS